MPVVSRVGGRKKYFSSKRKTRKTKTKKSRKPRKSGKSKKSRKHRRRRGEIDLNPPRLNVSGVPAGAVGTATVPTKIGLFRFRSRKRSVNTSIQAHFFAKSNVTYQSSSRVRHA